MDVLVGGTANQIIGAIAGNLCDPGVGAVGPGQSNRLKRRVGGGEEQGRAGPTPASQRQSRDREKGRARNRKGCGGLPDGP